MTLTRKELDTEWRTMFRKGKILHARNNKNLLAQNCSKEIRT